MKNQQHATATVSTGTFICCLASEWGHQAVRARACASAGGRRDSSAAATTILLNFDTENLNYKKHTPPLRVYIQVGSVPMTVLSQLDGSWIKPEMTAFFWSETNQHVRFGSNFEKVQNNVEKITSSTLKIKYAAPLRSGPIQPRGCVG